MNTATRVTPRQLPVLGVRSLSSSAYVLRFERGDFSFTPGQFLNLGLPGQIDMREYSIYSGQDDPFLEVLIKEIPGGLLSPRFKTLSPGDEVKMEGPFGFFSIKEETRRNPFLFVATGTGISPFHNMVASFPGLPFTLLHGIPGIEESYEEGHYPSSRLIRCTSRTGEGDFHGRVTDYLKEHRTAPETSCYLCGNSNMIYEVFDLLSHQGIPGENIFAEVYF